MKNIDVSSKANLKVGHKMRQNANLVIYLPRSYAKKCVWHVGFIIIIFLLVY